MKKSLVALSLLVSCSFANYIKHPLDLYPHCSSDDGTITKYLYLCVHPPQLSCCNHLRCVTPKDADTAASSCSPTGDCVNSSGQSGKWHDDVSNGGGACLSVPRYADYDPQTHQSACSSGTVNVGAKCHSTICPDGMTCSTNANGTLKMTASEDKIYTRKHANGDIDAIMKDGSYTTFDKNGNPVRYVDSNGNIVKDAIAAGTQSLYTTDPRGTPFNPIIAGGLIGSGYLLTAAGLLAGSGAGLPGAVMITAGAFMMAGGSISAVSSLIDPSGNPAPVSSAGQQGITIDLKSFDTGGSALAPTSTTQNANGSTTKVYKPNSDTTVTETEYYDGTVEYVAQNKTTNSTEAFSVNKSDLADKGSTTLRPQEIPVTQYTPNTDGTITTPNATYIPDIATGGVIPANPQQSARGGSSSSGGGSTSGGSSSSGGSTSGGSSSSSTGGGTMGNGQTSSAAGTDGNSTTDGQGKDFGSEFGDFATFKSWDEVLDPLRDFKKTITESFKNLKNSISSLKGTFQDGDSNSKINASLGPGAADSCNFSFLFRGKTIDLKDGIGMGADVFRPFITLIISIAMSVFSVVAVYKVIRGGAE